MIKIILLNGPSSSGKSTLARTLQKIIQERIDEHYEVISIDDHMKISTDETIYEDDVYEINGELCDKVVETLKTTSGVIVDHVITSKRIFDQFISICGVFPLLKVMAFCPLAVLQKRELARGDRHPGSAEASMEYLYPKDGYDLIVDTNAMTAEECAKCIFEMLFET